MTPQPHPGTAGNPCSCLPPCAEQTARGTSPAASVAGAFRRLTLSFTDNRLNGPLARRQPVAAHGWHWPSQREAARALGVSDPAVFRALRAGTFDRLVLQTLGVKG